MIRGVRRRLGAALLLATLVACPAAAAADGATTEYVDPQYRFGFRYPADWQKEQVPTPGEAGVVRLAAKSATKPLFVLAIVTPIASAITREEFERRPDRDGLVDEMIRQSLQQVYGKMSRDLSASRMVVDASERRAFDAGIGFSIHTTHTTAAGPTTVAGTHVVPFGERYVVTLLVVARGAAASPTEAETRRRLLDSLRLNPL
ncbi:MAG TPA: hypothetical protein VFE48_06485 [Methylomirabilota bacterium]|nr:hypothetical protein [Methylomirabilota bacterium]